MFNKSKEKIQIRKAVYANRKNEKQIKYVCKKCRKYPEIIPNVLRNIQCLKWKNLNNDSYYNALENLEDKIRVIQEEV